MTPSHARAAGAALSSLDQTSVLLLVGDSPVSLAAVARGAADATTGTRRVAIFDLAGAFGLHDYDGLITAFRDGRSLNALARPLADGDDRRFVVPRGPGDLDDEFARHERWPRLVGGFRDTGALLIIASLSEVAGLDTLSALSDQSLFLLEREDGCRLVSWPPSDADLFSDIIDPTDEDDLRETLPPSSDLRAESFPSDFIHTQITEENPVDTPADESFAGVLVDDVEIDVADDDVAGDSGAPAPDLAVDPRNVWTMPPEVREASPRKSPPPLVRITPASSMERVRSRRRFGGIVLGAVLVLSIGGWYWTRGRGHVAPGAQQTQAAGQTAGADSTLVLPALANPQDSAKSAAWSVELLATNDRSDAVSRLADNTRLSAATISPVLLGADGGTWYKVIAGAYVERAGAEYLRATLRQGGTLDPDAGVVSRAPYAFRLDHDLAQDAAKARVVRYVARGVAAYALLDDSARASVYVGAFASTGQAIILLAELKAAGLEPELAYRVGRTF